MNAGTRPSSLMVAAFHSRPRPLSRPLARSSTPPSNLAIREERLSSTQSIIYVKIIRIDLGAWQNILN